MTTAKFYIGPRENRSFVCSIRHDGYPHSEKIRNVLLSTETSEYYHYLNKLLLNRNHISLAENCSADYEYRYHNGRVHLDYGMTTDDCIPSRSEELTLNDTHISVQSSEDNPFDLLLILYGPMHGMLFPNIDEEVVYVRFEYPKWSHVARQTTNSVEICRLTKEILGTTSTNIPKQVWNCDVLDIDSGEIPS